jgi:hypothetical protein
MKSDKTPTLFKVYRKGEHPKPKRHYYPNSFAKRQQARQFCRNRSWEELTIVHPDGTEEPFN